MFYIRDERNDTQKMQYFSCHCENVAETIVDQLLWKSFSLIFIIWSIDCHLFFNTMLYFINVSYVMNFILIVLVNKRALTKCKNVLLWIDWQISVQCCSKTAVMCCFLRKIEWHNLQKIFKNEKFKFLLFSMHCSNCWKKEMRKYPFINKRTILIEYDNIGNKLHIGFQYFCSIVISTE